ncbi:hypothetical protein NDU88_011745 [Pleurodeles waltl]|uniref:Uncharacterized protein n=1 Tax=Pleurodeles waltl TaxID=8319 RepID=A0AAV7R2K1_PLEWA|nr:hypothetical protein NDU88_011745 [Pleurodeles waltl]
MALVDDKVSWALHLLRKAGSLHLLKEADSWAREQRPMQCVSEEVAVVVAAWSPPRKLKAEALSAGKEGPLRCHAGSPSGGIRGCGGSARPVPYAACLRAT